jgi:predicted dehydrogenase
MPSEHRPLRVGVVGAGHLGRIHIQQWREVAEAELIGFHEPDADRAALIMNEFGVQPSSKEDLIAGCDAIDIVTPTVTHSMLATQVLQAGRHLFIEKPLAERMDEADTLIELARKHGVKAQVGHVERFNPAFRAALPYLHEPMFIESHRLAQFNPRGTDVSVVLDLMIHDIDLVLHVVKSGVVDVQASGVAVVSDTPDIANARIAFANGCVANLTASRISLKNMRKNRFFQRDAYISVDLLERSSEIVRMRTVEGDGDPFGVTIDLGNGKGRRGISFEKPEIAPGNAIRDELRAFTLSVLNDTPTEVPLEDGRRAMEVAFRILECMRAHATATPTY